MDVLAALALAKVLSFSTVSSAPPPGAQPLVTRQPGTSISCAGVDKFAIRRCVGLRNTHLFECVNLGTGEVNGAVLSNPGYVRCSVSGVVYSTTSGDTCAQVNVCGRQETACLNDASTQGLLRCLGLL